MRIVLVCLAYKSGACREFTGEQSKIISHFQLHAIDFRQKTGCGQTTRYRICLDLSQVGQLGLEMADTLLGRLQFLVVGYHAGRLALDVAESGRIVVPTPPDVENEVFYRLNLCGVFVGNDDVELFFELHN
jgi:hypothetical protein